MLMIVKSIIRTIVQSTSEVRIVSQSISQSKYESSVQSSLALGKIKGYFAIFLELDDEIMLLESARGSV